MESRGEQELGAEAQLESPNLHELGLDRVIAFGHTWSPTLELTPRIPLRHGHAITVSCPPRGTRP
jgi:3-dehydroquinate synthetase